MACFLSCRLAGWGGGGFFEGGARFFEGFAILSTPPPSPPRVDGGQGTKHELLACMCQMRTERHRWIWAKTERPRLATDLGGTRDEGYLLRADRSLILLPNGLGGFSCCCSVPLRSTIRDPPILNDTAKVRSGESKRLSAFVSQQNQRFNLGILGRPPCSPPQPSFL